MTVYLAQVRLRAANAITADDVVNTFHVATTGTAVFDFLDVANAIERFYTITPAGETNNLGRYLNTTISRDADGCEIKAYNLSDPTPRTPIGTQTFSIGTALSAGRLPREVSLCLSYRAAYGSGIPNARRRGRIYFGPLVDSALNSDGVPTPTFVNTLVKAGDELRQALAATTSPWMVYSEVAGVASSVVSVWADNAFDTQRRRGQAPTARTTLP